MSEIDSMDTPVFIGLDLNTDAQGHSNKIQVARTKVRPNHKSGYRKELW